MAGVIYWSWRVKGIPDHIVESVTGVKNASRSWARAKSVIHSLYQQHYLSCRVVFASPEQIGVEFYHPGPGSQDILRESSYRPGYGAVERTFALAVSRAAATAIEHLREEWEKEKASEEREEGEEEQEETE